MRVRRLAVLLATPALLAALTPYTHARAAGTGAGSGPFDAYLAGGDASCVELTVATGYSFIVEPDARLPRATATIAEGSSGALAAPADPGDSVDALMGLMVPREEGQITGQMPQGMGAAVQQVLNPVNPHLEYPYEHASAQYPDPQKPGDAEASYLGAPNAAFSDPSGLVKVDGTSGDAKAGAAYATAAAGGGAATSLPMLGLSVGRLSGTSHAEVAADAVSNVVTCNLQDVTIAPPGSGLSLHVGSLIATLTTQRKLGSDTAASSRMLQVADVTLNGHDILPAGQGGIPIPPTTFTLPQPIPIPGVPVPVSIKSISIVGTATSDKLSANNNQATSTLTAATIVITTTAPVPSSIPPAPGQNPVSTTPAVYTLQFASLSSQTYGLPAVATSVSGGGGVPGVSGLAGGGAVSGGGGSFGGGSGGSVTVPGLPGSPATPGTKPLASSVLIPGTPAALRWGVVMLAALMEALLLTSLYLRRRSMRLRPNDLPAASFLDMP